MDLQIMDLSNSMNEKTPFRPLNQYGPPTIPVGGEGAARRRRGGAGRGGAGRGGALPRVFAMLALWRALCASVLLLASDPSRDKLSTKTLGQAGRGGAVRCLGRTASGGVLIGRHGPAARLTDLRADPSRR